MEWWINAINTKEANDISQVLFDIIKDTELWSVTFENLEKVGDTALQTLYDQLRKFQSGAGKNLDLKEFKELSKQIEKIEEQINKRNPFTTIKNSLVGYSNAMAEVSEKTLLLNFAQRKYNNAVERFGEDSPEAIDAYKGVSDATADMANAENDAQKNAYYLNTAIQQVSASVKGIGSATKTTV